MEQHPSNCVVPFHISSASVDDSLLLWVVTTYRHLVIDAKYNNSPPTVFNHFTSFLQISGSDDDWFLLWVFRMYRYLVIDDRNNNSLSIVLNQSYILPTDPGHFEDICIDEPFMGWWRKILPKHNTMEFYNSPYGRLGRL